MELNKRLARALGMGRPGSSGPGGRPRRDLLARAGDLWLAPIRREGLRARLQFALMSYAGAAGISAVGLMILLAGTPAGEEAFRAVQQVVEVPAEQAGGTIWPEQEWAVGGALSGRNGEGVEAGRLAGEGSRAA